MVVFCKLVITNSTQCRALQAFLQKQQSNICRVPLCSETRETLAHLAVVCPSFREARTAALLAPCEVPPRPLGTA